MIKIACGIAIFTTTFVFFGPLDSAEAQLLRSRRSGVVCQIQCSPCEQPSPEKLLCSELSEPCRTLCYNNLNMNPPRVTTYCQTNSCGAMSDMTKICTEEENGNNAKCHCCDSMNLCTEIISQPINCCVCQHYPRRFSWGCLRSWCRRGCR